MVGTCFHSDLSRVQLCARLFVLMECARAIAMQAAADGYPEGTAAQAIEEEIVRIEDTIYTIDLVDAEPAAEVAERRQFNAAARRAFGIGRDEQHGRDEVAA